MSALPHFDAALEMWVVSRYADVVAALREPRLSASGARGGSEIDREHHRRFRADASVATAEMLQKTLPSLPVPPHDRPIDLVSEVAMPWSAQVAKDLLHPTGDPERLTAFAADVFAAASDPRDLAQRARADTATRELAVAFSGPLAAFHIQAFVALTQTLPRFLANAWLALLRDPEPAELLRNEPELMPAAIEELLRHSGPSRAQFRRASESATLNGISINAGDSVALMLAAANRDPDQFPEPDKLDFRRDPIRHLAFGDGPHVCIGAPLIRAAAAAATAHFVANFAGARLDAIEWHAGFAICAPAAVRITAPV